MPAHLSASSIPKKGRQKIPIFDDQKDLEKFLEMSFADSLKQMIKLLVKTTIKTEMEQIKKQLASDQGQCLQFNGYYPRRMISTFGEIKGVPIPRFRQNPENFDLRSTQVFTGEYENFMKLVEQMHLHGISQRKISDVMKECLGVKISKNRVGTIYRELVEAEDVALNQQPLSDDFDYLYLDGIWETTKGFGWDDNRSVMICALGYNSKREQTKILGFYFSRTEDTHAITILLKQLKQRGLAGANLKLVIGDDNPAFGAAVTKVYGNLPIQNCIVHKMRNVITKTSKNNKAQVATDLKIIFNQTTRGEAITNAKVVVKKWYQIEARAMESLRFNLENCFNYLDFPAEHWHAIRTSNALERRFREVRRRMKGFDSSFNSPASANRYFNSITNYLNESYPRSSKAVTQ